MEKNTGSCAIKSSRKRHFQEFFRVKKQTANCRIHEVLRSTTRPSQPSILERSYSFYGSCKAQALSPIYFCKQICFPMNGGGKQNQCLRMECVILGTDVVGVLSPISLTDNSLNKWKQVKCYLISVKYYCIHILALWDPPTFDSERGTFSEAVTRGGVLKMTWQLTGRTLIKPTGFLMFFSSLSCNPPQLRQGSLLLFNMRSFIRTVSRLSEWTH